MGYIGMCSLMKEVFRRTVLWDSDVKQLLQAQQLRNILESGFFLLKGKLGTRYYVEWSAQCRRVLCSLSHALAPDIRVDEDGAKCAI